MDSETAAMDFPLVCIGGSSADVDAYTELLGDLRHDLGIGIVIVNHLSLVGDLLLERLPHFTKMPVLLISEGMLIQPDHIYVSPGERDVHIRDGAFGLKPISKPTGWPDVITVLFRSLTKHWSGRLIAVIYSGYGGDGASALQGLKESGATVIAREASSADQPDMPLSAIASGYVDFILPVAGIAAEIAREAQAARAKRSNADLIALAKSVEVPGRSEDRGLESLNAAEKATESKHLP
jgi:two-component system chemotaxis response regulator CheB